MNRVSLKVLLDSGLLYEINRQILHPLGYSLSYKAANGTYNADELILQQTTDPEGVLFPEEAFMEGASKFSLYMRKFGEELIKRRLSTKGFIRQTRSDQ